jgi:hypothetical protein
MKKNYGLYHARNATETGGKQKSRNSDMSVVTVVGHGIK